jgi:hypothetical protein
MRRRWLAAGFVLAAALLVTTPATAGFLVLHASGPSASRFTTGMVLPDEVVVELGATDRLLLLGPRGTRILNGPGTFRPSLPPGPVALQLAQAAERRRVSASRHNISTVPPSLWQLSLEAVVSPERQTGKSTFCARGNAAIGVWNGRFQSVRIEQEEGFSPTLTWSNDQRIVEWQPLGTAAAFDAIAQIEPYERLLVLRVIRLNAVPEDPGAVLDIFVREGCADQAWRLRDRLVESVDLLTNSEGDLGWRAAAAHLLE